MCRIRLVLLSYSQFELLFYYVRIGLILFYRCILGLLFGLRGLELRFLGLIG